MDTNDTIAPSLFDEGLIRVGEAARLLGLSRSHVYALMDRGELPFWKLGKCRRIPRSALTKLMADHLVTKNVPGVVH